VVDLYKRVIPPIIVISLAWLIAAGARSLALTLANYSFDGPWGVQLFFFIPDLDWIVLPLVLVAMVRCREQRGSANEQVLIAFVPAMVAVAVLIWGVIDADLQIDDPTSLVWGLRRLVPWLGTSVAAAYLLPFIEHRLRKAQGVR
jgi:hypothetical protein